MGGAAGRGLLVVLAAVVIGLVLLNSGLDGGGGSVSAVTLPSGSTTKPTTKPTTATTKATTSGSDTTVATVPGSTRPTNQVKVFVANAAAIKGAAGRLADVLKAAGYVAVTGNITPKIANSVVYYVQGSQSEAAAVAQAIGANPANVVVMPVPPPIADLQGAQVLVALGTDLAKSG